ncbi:MAG: sulfate transporter CysZ [Xanthomonadales bacterium]|nr:sulfate transporter CysZ [Xanthomonadales bacterium]
MLADLGRGASGLLSGFRMILRPGLRRFVIVPAALNTVLFGSVIFLAGNYFGELMERLIPNWAGWLEYLLWPLFALTVLVIVYYTFTLLANLIGAPFNERLAIAVAQRQGWTGRLPERTLAAGIAGALVGELRKWVYFAVLILLALALWLFPLTTLLTPLIWTLLSAWMLAMEYLDHPLELEGLDFADKRAWLRRNRGLTLGFGLATLAATLVPFVNFLVMPAAVAGATGLWATRQESDA